MSSCRVAAGRRGRSICLTDLLVSYFAIKLVRSLGPNWEAGSRGSNAAQAAAMIVARAYTEKVANAETPSMRSSPTNGVRQPAVRMKTEPSPSPSERTFVGKASEV